MQHFRFTTLHRVLLAALFAGAGMSSAFAQTSVNVEGLVDAFAGSMRMAGATDRTAKVDSAGMSTSYFGFRGSEDLGGGMKANFALTGFFRGDTGESGRFPGNETLFSRDANVGVSGSFGAISLGRGLAPNFLPSILFNPFGDSFTFSPLILHLNVPLFNASGWSSSLAGDTGWSNQIKYTTPTFGGLTANLHYQFGEAAGDTGKNNIGGNLLYFSGPLSLTAFYHKVEANNPLDTPLGNVKAVAGRVASEQKAWFVGAGYDFNVVKLNGTFDKTTHDADFEDKTYSVGASAPAGNGKVLIAYAQTKRTGGGLDGSTRKTASVGYDYNLSRRTDAYAVYMNDRITGFDSGNSFGAGIRHRF
ncbi:porin [Noviherbaspirillum massiliense]|uniref:porin n=1 Tax=Noviherbaspirillum massiliense TaxID=1465823 RepID=UPI0004746F02|nr:porin [Noviherbaspirillum massiliense]